MLLIFDLDDTLIDTSGSILPKRRAAALLEMMAAGLTVPSIEKATKIYADIDAASENSLMALKKFLGDQDQFFPVGKEKILYDRNFDFEIETTPLAISALEKLKQHHTLALVTYGIPEIQHLKLKKTGLDTPFFSTIVVTQSGEKGPHYQKLINEYGMEAMVIGDRVERDLSPAKALGIYTVQMRWGRGKGCAPHPDVDAQIDTLSALIPLVEEKIQL